MDPAIFVQNLRKSYGSVEAIRSLSFAVEHGSIVGFLGPNGAGKSSTMRILSGIIPGTSGKAWVCGCSLATQPEQVKSLIGYMPENNPLPEDLRVDEYLCYRARLKGIAPNKILDEIERVMEACDLMRKGRNKLIGVLSKGFRQRVGIADALIGSPKVILLDEPTIGLDPHQILGVRSLIEQLRGKMTVLISSHILSEIEAICDRVIIMNNGYLVAEGSVSSLCEEFFPEPAYVLELNQQDAEVTTLLKQFGATSVKETVLENGASRFSISLELSVQPADFLARCTEAFEGSVRTFCAKKATLEAIFIAATKRNRIAKLKGAV